MRAISYSLSQDKSEMTIYSHAGIGINTIKALAEKIGVVYVDATSADLAATIDSINDKFQDHVQAGTVNSLYAPESLKSGYDNQFADLSHDPFAFIMWNRRYDSIDRSEDYNGYKLKFVHGHDRSGYHDKNIYNLNNLLGTIGPYGWVMNIEKYTVLYSAADTITQGLRKEYPAASTPQRSAAPDRVAIDDLDKTVVVEVRSQPEIDNTTVVTVVEEQSSVLYKESYEEVQYRLNVLYSLDAIQSKEVELRARGFSQAANEARTLKDNITCDLSLLQGGKITREYFQAKSAGAINNACKELEKHRGFRRILVNLACAIFGLGIFYAIAGIIHKRKTGSFLFFNKTDSIEKVEKLNDAIRAGSCIVPCKLILPPQTSSSNPP